MVKPQYLVVLWGADANCWPFIQLYDEFNRGSIPMDRKSCPFNDLSSNFGQVTA